MADEWAWSPGSHMKVCFVTTGATAPFIGLIESILDRSSTDALVAAGYTHLLIQYGVAKDAMIDKLQLDPSGTQSDSQTGKLIIGGFDFSREGLKEQFMLV